MARLAGGPKAITADINMEEWAKQAEKYEELCNDNLWDKSLQLSVVIDLDHPLNAVRVREILNWGKSQQYKNLMQNLNAEASGKKCPKCNRAVCADWAYCKHCGAKL
jgi:hypothetical protein